MTTIALANYAKVKLAKIEEAVKAGYLYLLPCPSHVPFEKRHVLYNAQARSFIRSAGDIDLEKYMQFVRRGKFYILIGNTSIYKDDDTYYAYTPGREEYSSTSYDDILLYANAKDEGEHLVPLTGIEISTILMALERLDLEMDNTLKNKLTNVIRT